MTSSWAAVNVGGEKGNCVLTCFIKVHLVCASLPAWINSLLGQLGLKMILFHVYKKGVGLLLFRLISFCFACSNLPRRILTLQFLLASWIYANIDIKLFRRPVFISCCSWPGGCSSRGTEQPIGWEWCPNRPSGSSGHIWRSKLALRQKTQSVTAATRDSAGRELQVFHFHLKCTLLFTIDPWCWCAASRLEAAKDDYRIHCEELEKQLIELQHRNDELTSLAEESQALKDELDVMRSVFDGRWWEGRSLLEKHCFSI